MVVILDNPFKEVHLIQFTEACILHFIVTETPVAHIEPYFWSRLCQSEQTQQEREPWPSFFGSNKAAGDHLALSDATRQSVSFSGQKI